jgi:hypothetical protein
LLERSLLMACIPTVAAMIVFNIGDLVVLIRQKTIINVHLSHVETSMIKSKLND